MGSQDPIQVSIDSGEGSSHIEKNKAPLEVTQLTNGAIVQPVMPVMLENPITPENSPSSEKGVDPQNGTRKLSEKIKVTLPKPREEREGDEKHPNEKEPTYEEQLLQDAKEGKRSPFQTIKLTIKRRNGRILRKLSLGIKVVMPVFISLGFVGSVLTLTALAGLLFTGLGVVFAGMAAVIGLTSLQLIGAFSAVSLLSFGAVGGGVLTLKLMKRDWGKDHFPPKLNGRKLTEVKEKGRPLGALFLWVIFAFWFVSKFRVEWVRTQHSQTSKGGSASLDPPYKCAKL